MPPHSPLRHCRSRRQGAPPGRALPVRASARRCLLLALARFLRALRFLMRSRSEACAWSGPSATASPGPSPVPSPPVRPPATRKRPTQVETTARPAVLCSFIPPPLDGGRGALRTRTDTDRPSERTPLPGRKEKGSKRHAIPGATGEGDSPSPRPMTRWAGVCGGWTASGLAAAPRWPPRPSGPGGTAVGSWPPVGAICPRGAGSNVAGGGPAPGTGCVGSAARLD